MNQIALIQRLFGNRPHDCAMDANAEWREEAHHRGKGGQFAKGSGGAGSSASSSAPKKKAKAEGSATPAKPQAVKTRSKTDAHVKEREKHLAKEAKAAAKPAPKEKPKPKPKKPTQAERVTKKPSDTPAPKAEAPAPKKANPNLSAAKRAATALQKFEAGLEGKSASEIRKLEAQHIGLLDKANASAKKAGVPTDAFEKKGKTGKSPSKPKAAQTEGGKQEAVMRASFSTINSVAKSVPQKLEDAKSYSPDWRHLLQTVRNMDASPHLSAVGMESIRKAARGIKPVPSGEHAAAERNALLAALKKTKATKPSRRRGGPNPDLAS